MNILKIRWPTATMSTRMKMTHSQLILPITNFLSLFTGCRPKHGCHSNSLDLAPGRSPAPGKIMGEPPLRADALAAKSAKPKPEVEYDDAHFRPKISKNMASYQLADGAATRHGTCNQVDWNREHGGPIVVNLPMDLPAGATARSPGRHRATLDME